MGMAGMFKATRHSTIAQMDDVVAASVRASAGP
jgi:hypothetical protein